MLAAYRDPDRAAGVRTTIRSVTDDIPDCDGQGAFGQGAAEFVWLLDVLTCLLRPARPATGPRKP